MNEEKQNLLSIIVPIYNIKNYLKKCIESIIKQTYYDLEIILVDDGSTDGCGELCEKYACVDKRIIVIHKKNGGLISARKAGIQVARGEYVTFVDGDDWIESDLYERIMINIADKNYDMFCYGFKQDMGKSYNIVSNLAGSGEYKGEKLQEEVLSGLICGKNTFRGTIISSVWSKVFRKEILYESLMRMAENYALGEDCVCTASCILGSTYIGISNEICGYHYRFNNESIINSFDKLFCEHSIALYNEINRVIQENGYPQLRGQMLRYIVSIVVMGVAKLTNRKNKISFRKQYLYLKHLIENREIKEILLESNAEQIPFEGKNLILYNLLIKKQLARIILAGIIPYRWYH